MCFDEKEEGKLTIGGYTEPTFGIVPTDGMPEILKKIAKKYTDLENLINQCCVTESNTTTKYVTGDYTMSVVSTEDVNYLNYDLSSLSTQGKKIDTTIKVYSTNQNGALYPIYTSSSKDEGVVPLNNTLFPVKVIIDHRRVENGKTIHFTDEKDLNLGASIKDFMDYSCLGTSKTTKEFLESLQTRVDYLSGKIN